MSLSTLEFNENNFKDEVLTSDKPVLVDFWAQWCGPCKMLTPVIDELADEFKDTAKIGKVNVDESPSIATDYGIRSIPCLLFFIRISIMWLPKYPAPPVTKIFFIF